MKNQEDLNQARLLREYFLNACLLADMIKFSQEATTTAPKPKAKARATRRRRVPELI